MGIALRQSEPEFGIVDTYYARSKREPTKRGDLEVARTDAFRSNFLDLLRMLDAKQQSHVVIVAHGSESGFIMPLTSTTDVSAGNGPLVNLLAMADQWPSPDAKAMSDFTSTNKVTEDEVRAMLALCHKIRHHESNCFAVHVRGCKIGKSLDNLVTIRKLLNSQVVSAPKCPMLYASFDPRWRTPQLDIDQWMKDNAPDTRRREFVDAAAGMGRVVLDCDYGGSSGSASGAVQRSADTARFATLVYGRQQHGVSNVMTVAAMWPDTGYALPHEKAYVDQIVATRGD